MCAWLRKSVAKVPGQNFDHRWLFRKINQHPRSEKGNVSGSFVDSGALEVNGSGSDFLQEAGHDGDQQKPVGGFPYQHVSDV